MRQLIAVVLCASVLGGCSFFMTKPPAVDPGTRPLKCEQSKVPPYADTVGAGLFALTGIISIPLKSDNTSTATFVVADVAAFGVAAVFAYSAFTGFKAVKRCRELEAMPPTPVRE